MKKPVLFLFLVMLNFISGKIIAQKSEADSLLNVIQNSKEDSLRVKLTFDAVRIFMYEKIDTVPYLLKDMERISAKLKFKRGFAQAYAGYGIYYQYKNDFPKAAKYTKDALKIRTELKDTMAIVDMNNNLGVIYDYMGNYSEATRYHLESMKMAEASKDTFGWSRSLNNLGVILKLQKRYEEALSNFKKSLELRILTQDEYGIASSALNVGTSLLYQKKFSEAEPFLRKALSIGKEIGDIFIISDAAAGIGSMHYDQEHLDSALYYFRQGMEAYELSDDKRGASDVFSQIADIYYKKKDYSQAEGYFSKSFALAKSVNYKFGMRTAALGLAHCYALISQGEKSVEFMQEYVTLSDSLFSERTTSQLEEMQTKYETDKNREKIKQQQALIESADREVAAQEKARIFLITGIILLLAFLAYAVYGYLQKVKTAKLLETQKKIIELKNKETTDSIQYAKKIQTAILTSEEYWNNISDEHFIFFRPKDIVSGDFYWAYVTPEGESIWTAADCTGHGVPGAFMSMISSSLLNEIVVENKIYSPDEVLNKLRQKIIRSLESQDTEYHQRDGLDIALCRYNPITRKLSFAGANNAAYILRGSDLIELKADKMPVGKSHGIEHPFSLQEIDIMPGDCVYVFSDGYGDQFGGENGKKFKLSRFKELIQQMAGIPIQRQAMLLETNFQTWKGNFEQLDDVCVIGIRLK